MKNKDTINVINTIRQKLEKITIEQPPKTINSKLEQLAMHYSLDDFVIISSSEIKTLNVIDKMRNGIAHDGNFFPSGYKMQRLRLNAYRHLADLTIRIFLSWIDFTGRYKSPIGYVSKSKEWVEKNLSHKALGYD